MSQKTAAEKRKESNLKSLDDCTEAIARNEKDVQNEVRQFQDRVSRIQGHEGTNGFEEINESLSRFSGVMEKYTMSIRMHNTALKIVLNNIPTQLKSGSVPTPESLPPISGVPISAGGQRRPRRTVRSYTAEPVMESTPESTMEQADQSNNFLAPNTPLKQIESINDDAMSVATSAYTPSGIRRRRRPATKADTEYTGASGEVDDPMPNISSVIQNSDSNISKPECATMQPFINYLETTDLDPTYKETLLLSVETQRCTSTISTDILNYIRKRKNEDMSYDSYDELAITDSDTYIWFKSYLSDL